MTCGAGVTKFLGSCAGRYKPSRGRVMVASAMRTILILPGEWPSEGHRLRATAFARRRQQKRRHCGKLWA